MLEAILFPSDYFNKKVVDSELKKEYYAAIECNKYNDIYIFSYDDWFNNETILLNNIPKSKINAVYRGWMMLPSQYEKFYHSLIDQNIQLVTTPDEYELLHIFPNIYPQIIQDTPRTLTFPQGTTIDLLKVKNVFSKFIVKDYVKSVKGTDFPSYFNSDIEQTVFDEWMKKFYQYRGKLFTGGICIKEYVDFKWYSNAKNEYRVFYMNGEIGTISRNSGQAEFCPLPPIELIEKYRNLNSCFYTIDFAELENGKWIVVEAGDGSVSGLSDFQNYNDFFRKLYYSFV